MSFHPSAAAAQQAGFRACKRCRPDAVPGSPEWNERADLAARAMRLIKDGIVDREGTAGLAARLGYSLRQIERRLRAEVGAGPAALARAQRAQAARLLIEATALPMADVAFMSGFSSVRAFNDTVRAVFGLSPTGLRHRGRPADVTGAVSLRLPFRVPLFPDDLFGALRPPRAPGIPSGSKVARHRPYWGGRRNGQRATSCAVTAVYHFDVLNWPTGKCSPQGTRNRARYVPDREIGDMMRFRRSARPAARIRVRGARPAILGVGGMNSRARTAR